VSVACKVQLDGGSAQLVSPVATLIAQITPAANAAVRMTSVVLQTNQCNPPANLPVLPGGPTVAQSIALQWGIFAASPSSSGGLTPLALPIDDQYLGIYTPSTTFRTFSPNLGTGFAATRAFLWDTTNDFVWNTPNYSEDPSRRREYLGEGLKAPAVYALVMAAQYIQPLQQPFSVVGHVAFIEDR
jgi:hypothetical protein